MPICLNPVMTLKPTVADCGMPCPDEELIDLETPSCSPSYKNIGPDYQIITDGGWQRLKRTAQVISDHFERLEQLLDDPDEVQ